jgi:hypothetical protein
MGGTKVLGAFTKATEEAQTLLNLFTSGPLELTATPGDVYPLFPKLRTRWLISSDRALT